MRRPKQSLSCFLTKATWQINEQNCISSNRQLHEFQNSEAISPKNWYKLIDNLGNKAQQDLTYFTENFHTKIWLAEINIFNLKST